MQDDAEVMLLEEGLMIQNILLLWICGTWDAPSEVEKLVGSVQIRMD